jgi:hypothetical protein
MDARCPTGTVRPSRALRQARPSGAAGGCDDGAVSRKPVLRVRKSGALLVAALIAFVGTVPFAGVRWVLAPILLIPLAVLVWAWRAGTDVDTESLRVRALLGKTVVPWSRVAELAPDDRGQVSALLVDGTVIALTGVTVGNLPTVLAAGGQEVSSPEEPG